MNRTDGGAPAPNQSVERSPNIALALSGGGSRAIAFHLGCLRELNARGILERVSVVSAVSGGSVIAGMYAYRKEDFDAFDQRTVEFLRRGLVWSTVRHLLSPSLLLLIAATKLVSSPIARAAKLFKKEPPLRRWASRTLALEGALRSVLGDPMLSQVARPGLDVIFNACELRTGTAFRFGNQRSGSWRFGEIENNEVPLSHAVTCSAAYPLFLPALDEMWTFKKDGKLSRERVVITDGGVFDNLGLTCIEPGRSGDYSLHVYNPDYILCCSAGHGQFSGKAIPYHFCSRMSAAFSSTFRKVQDGAFGRLHEHEKAGRIKGFILPYLGQQDSVLPSPPADLVAREEVGDYPTNFSPMRKENVRRLTLRGEQLTRILLSHYLPGL
ncbi:MAG: hypothetical protein GHCLOJNM_00209 [bacterium]|nr:hypothetical protein [bacterium]